MMDSHGLRRGLFSFALPGWTCSHGFEKQWADAV